MNEKLANTNSLLDKEYFENMDLNEDMEKIYSLIKNNEEYSEYEKEMNLSKLRIDNHKKYHRIKINLIEDLPNYFYLDVKNIKSIYSKINENKLLSENYEEAEKNKYRLIELEKAFNELKFKVEKELKNILKKNNNDQKLWGFDVFKNLVFDKDELKKVLNYYDTLLFITANVYDDVFSEYKNELVRRKIIDKINKILDEEAEKLKNSAKIKELRILNNKIEEGIRKLNDKLNYLDKLVPDNSEYLPDYKKFKMICETLINYDKESLKDVRETYKVLCVEEKLDIFIKRFETFFLIELEKLIKGKEYQKLEIEMEELKEIIKKIEEYSDFLDSENNKYIRNLKRSIKEKIIDIKKEKEKINNLIRKIWNKYLTDINLFNFNIDYHFICSNNQFILPIQECILITKKMIEQDSNYGEYQIGFICDSLDKIMYMTNKEDIIDKEDQDLDYLKLPNEIEENFRSFKDCTKIALDGNSTSFIAVYFIDDGDNIKLKTAEELSNTYNIPLIKFKRDN